jgi:CheY-like chemotaxis protein
MAKILVVDDNPSTRALIRDALELEGHQVAAVGDGASALAEIERDIPAVVILDVRMPGMDGPAVLEKLRQTEETQELPVVILSGITDRDWRRCTGEGHYFMTKPFDPDDLITVVNRLAGQFAA